MDDTEKLDMLRYFPVKQGETKRAKQLSIEASLLLLAADLTKESMAETKQTVAILREVADCAASGNPLLPRGPEAAAFQTSINQSRAHLSYFQPTGIDPETGKATGHVVAKTDKAVLLDDIARALGYGNWSALLLRQELRALSIVGQPEKTSSLQNTHADRLQTIIRELAFSALDFLKPTASTTAARPPAFSMDILPALATTVNIAKAATGPVAELKARNRVMAFFGNIEAYEQVPAFGESRLYTRSLAKQANHACWELGKISAPVPVEAAFTVADEAAPAKRLAGRLGVVDGGSAVDQPVLPGVKIFGRANPRRAYTRSA
jgi:hypothetical protein